MYLKLDEDLKNKIEKITSVDYDFKGDYLPSENIEAMLNDLLTEIERLEESKKELSDDLENNYELKKVDTFMEYGVSDRDFY